MEALVIILSVVWAVLNIILFFKIWGMTNDVTAIRDILEAKLSAPSTSSTGQQTFSNPVPQDKDAMSGVFEVGSLVVEISTGRQMRIKEITKEGKYSCYVNNYSNFCGDFTSDQIESFKDYTSKLKK